MGNKPRGGCVVECSLFEMLFGKKCTVGVAINDDEIIEELIRDMDDYFPAPEKESIGRVLSTEALQELEESFPSEERLSRNKEKCMS